MSENNSYKNGKRFLKHFSNGRERNMMEIADEEYIEIGEYENDNLPDTFYNEDMLGLYNWDEL